MLLAGIYSTLQAVVHKNIILDIRIPSQALTRAGLAIMTFIGIYFIVTRRAT